MINYETRNLLIKMIDATSDQIFIAIVRGAVKASKCEKDQKFLEQIRAKLYLEKDPKIDILNVSNNLVELFEKYRADSVNKFIQTYIKA
ncbi:hypothetical protein KDD93_01015 [Campylobacter sp. faydin G-24]|uniref:Uncharacterized protein n=1 Tax=Campylobacter anatolicus TaxID=2829105 RepID=A0ABS5HFV6_9BACT|nr:hypothetical protein [Campylobacter anatolicus]MBR8462393.1 hypothetical protein [Campylobacter anatolicus]MBR8463154.1 hypothetical protein [Campylobacter anatolicus]MBR8465526.1 hypothetical protein [Campylobacter anatolicus]